MVLLSLRRQTLTLMKKMTKIRRVRLTVEAAGDLRFYDLPTPRLSRKRLERVLADATAAFARTFADSVEAQRGRARWQPRQSASDGQASLVGVHRSIDR